MRSTARVHPLVRRALRIRGLRSAIALTGVATSVLLVLVLFASFRSVEISVHDYIGQAGADVWIAPFGTDNLVRSSALLPEELVAMMGSVVGVADASPVLRSFVTVQPPAGSKSSPRGLTLLAIGYRVPDGLGGPPSLVEGRAPVAGDEVVLDRAAAYRLGARLGDSVAVNGRPMRIVGKTAHTNIVSTQFVFLDSSVAQQLSGYTGRTSFVVIRLRAGTSASDFVRRVSDNVAFLAAYERETFIENNQEEVFAGFRPVQMLVSLVGLIAASILVALLVQATVDDRLEDIAVLFAMGASTRSIALAVVAHTMFLVLSGTLLGALASRLLAAALVRWIPTIDMSTRLVDTAVALAVFGGIGVLASILPLLRLRRVDPVEAFRP